MVRFRKVLLFFMDRTQVHRTSSTTSETCGPRSPRGNFGRHIFGSKKKKSTHKCGALALYRSRQVGEKKKHQEASAVPWLTRTCTNTAQTSTANPRRRTPHPPEQSHLSQASRPHLSASPQAPPRFPTAPQCSHAIHHGRQGFEMPQWRCSPSPDSLPRPGARQRLQRTEHTMCI